MYKGILSVLLSGAIIFNSVMPSFAGEKLFSDPRAAKAMDKLIADTNAIYKEHKLPVITGGITITSAVTAVGIAERSRNLTALARTNINYNFYSEAKGLHNKFALVEDMATKTTDKSLNYIKGLMNKKGMSSYNKFLEHVQTKEPALLPNTKVQSVLEYQAARENLKLAAENSIGNMQMTTAERYAFVSQNLEQAKTRFASISKLEGSGVYTTTYSKTTAFQEVLTEVAPLSNKAGEAASKFRTIARWNTAGKVFTIITLIGVVVIAISLTNAVAPQSVSATDRAALAASESYIFEMPAEIAEKYGFGPLKELYRPLLEKYDTDPLFREVYQADLISNEVKNLKFLEDIQKKLMSDNNMAEAIPPSVERYEDTARQLEQMSGKLFKG